MPVNKKISYKYSDRTMCVVGPGYDQYSKINSGEIVWEKGEYANAPRKIKDFKTNTFQYPSLEMGGWAFQSVLDFEPKKFKNKKIGYPFGGKYLYARLGLPQHEQLSSIISQLERVPGGVLAPSGVAASHLAVLFNLPAGATIFHSLPMYDCTRSAHDKIFPRLNINSIGVDFTNLVELEKIIKQHKPYKLYCESPANPTMSMIDLPKLYRLAVRYKVKEIVFDNTFASPIIQKPVEIVKGDPYKILRIIHSGSKHFSGGLEGVTWGYCSLIDWKEYPAMLIFQKDMGYNMSGIDADSILRHSMPTLCHRVKMQSASALKLAKFLSKSPLVNFVNYPGLRPFKAMADKYYTGEGYGSILYFEFRDNVGKNRQESMEMAEAFGDILALQSFICLGVSLGNVRTLIENSWFMVHRFMDEEAKVRSGISPFGWRVAVGFEEVDDIMHDISLAMELMMDKKYRDKVKKFKKQIGKPST